MSRVDDLIDELCPDGVEYKALGDIATLVRGNGLPKSDFTDSGVGCIHYGQIYTYYRTWTTTAISHVAPETGARLAKVDPGDVIVTNTSENIEDVCKAVAWLGDDQIVTGGHATVIKHDQNPKYLAYYLQTPSFAAEKNKYATGTKVIDVSARSLAKIRIPVPPLEVQREIVRILDTFAELEAGLEAELEAELEARRRQYAHYRDSLLAIGPDSGVEWLPLEQLGSLYGGLTGKSKADFEDGNAAFVSYMNVFSNLATRTEPSDWVRIRAGERQNRVLRGDVLFTASSETLDEVGMSSTVTADPQSVLYLNSFCFGFRPERDDFLNPDFAKHLFRSDSMRRQITRTASGVTRINISKKRFAKIQLPIVRIDEQARIAGVLDRLDALVNDLSICLPAELAARRKQYEFYRDKLLTFREAAA